MDKKWFHIFSLFLILVSLFLGFSQMSRDWSIFLEVKLGSGEGEPFITSFFVWDSITNVFVIMVGSVSYLVMKYAYWYMHGEKKWNAFFITFFVFVFFMFLMSVSSSLFWVILGWDGLGMTSFCLVMFFSSWKSFNSALITFLMNRFGDFFFILSIWAYMCFFSSDCYTVTLLGLFIALTGMTKSAQVPFSAWLPAAMAAPTPVSSLVHSSTLVTAGVFLFSRFHEFLSGLSLKLIYFSSLITILLSGMSALGENDLKKIIALSTLSHLGFMMFFLSKNMVQITMIHLLVHAFFKSLLFMAAGVIIHMNFNNQDIRKLVGLNPPLILVLMIAILANMGVPFLSGFYSKEFLVFSLFSMENPFFLLDSVVILFSVLLTCLYSMRIFFCILMSETSICSSESTSIKNYPLLNWMLFSSLFSCFSGGFLVWLLVDPCQEVEKSVFLTMVKITVIISFCLAFFFIKTGMTSFFFSQNAKMWFIYEFSKLMSSTYFYTSNIFLTEIDLKGFLGKTPKLQDLFLKEELMLKKPKKIFTVCVFLLCVFFIQFFLLKTTKFFTISQ